MYVQMGMSQFCKYPANTKINRDLELFRRLTNNSMISTIPSYIYDRYYKIIITKKDLTAKSEDITLSNIARYAEPVRI
mgnify:CR=1 FL=1